jgi:hypothetical protein
MRSLLADGQGDAAAKRLKSDLEGFDGAIARLCQRALGETAVLEGFEDLLPILEEWEGPAITGITLGLTNPSDLVFEAGATHEPELLIALFSDESFPFSTASKSDLIAECEKEAPAWLGAEEDVEFHCTIPALAELNTALIHCKHRHYLRDGRDGVEGRAPGGYVEYVLGSWLLATLFLRSVQQAVTDHGLPAGCQLAVGTLDIGADFICVLGGKRRARARAAAGGSTSQGPFAPLTAKPWVPREDPTAEEAASAPTLRQRLLSEEPAPPVAASGGFFARLLRRFSRR